jgi:TPR repeat protein
MRTLTRALLLGTVLVTPAAAQKAQPKPPAAAQPATPDPGDVAFGAYQRGQFITAFNEASTRAQAGDVKAMTLLGELYANGQGVGRDDAKAAEWYKRAADAGDANAMFALGTFELDGRAGPRNRAAALDWFTQAAKRGNANAAYNVGLANLEPQGDIKAAAEFLKIGAKAGLPDAQYALSAMYREGRGVEKNPQESIRLLQAASAAEFPDAMLEYAIALFNGANVKKDEAAGVFLLRKTALRGSPIAQNRLAYAYTMGRGIKADPVQAVKWHYAAKAGGLGDPKLDEYAAQQTADVRKQAEAGAKPWIEYYQRPRP